MFKAQKQPAFGLFIHYYSYLLRSDPERTAVRLARLAVDTRFQARGYGGRLLAEAIHRTVLIAEHAGVIGLFVDAKDETACLFYQRYDFKSLPDNIQKLFLPIETLRKGSLR